MRLLASVLVLLLARFAAAQCTEPTWVTELPLTVDYNPDNAEQVESIFILEGDKFNADNADVTIQLEANFADLEYSIYYGSYTKEDAATWRADPSQLCNDIDFTNAAAASAILRGALNTYTFESLAPGQFVVLRVLDINGPGQDTTTQDPYTLTITQQFGEPDVSDSFGDNSRDYQGAAPQIHGVNTFIQLCGTDDLVTIVGKHFGDLPGSVTWLGHLCSTQSALATPGFERIAGERRQDIYECSIYSWSDEMIVLDGTPGVRAVPLLVNDNEEYRAFRSVSVTRGDGTSVTVDSTLYFAPPEIIDITPKNVDIQPSGGIVFTVVGRNLGYPDIQPNEDYPEDLCQVQICFSDDPRSCCKNTALIDEMCSGSNLDITSFTCEVPNVNTWAPSLSDKFSLRVVRHCNFDNHIQVGSADNDQLISFPVFGVEEAQEIAVVVAEMSAIEGQDLVLQLENHKREALRIFDVASTIAFIGSTFAISSAVSTPLDRDVWPTELTVGTVDQFTQFSDLNDISYGPSFLLTPFPGTIAAGGATVLPSTNLRTRLNDMVRPGFRTNAYRLYFKTSQVTSFTSVSIYFADSADLLDVTNPLANPPAVATLPAGNLITSINNIDTSNTPVVGDALFGYSFTIPGASLDIIHYWTAGQTPVIVFNGVNMQLGDMTMQLDLIYEDGEVRAIRLLDGCIGFYQSGSDLIFTDTGASLITGQLTDARSAQVVVYRPTADSGLVGLDSNIDFDVSFDVFDKDASTGNFFVPDSEFRLYASFEGDSTDSTAQAILMFLDQNNDLIRFPPVSWAETQAEFKINLPTMSHLAPRNLMSILRQDSLQAIDYLPSLTIFGSNLGSSIVRQGVDEFGSTKPVIELGPVSVGNTDEYPLLVRFDEFDYNFIPNAIKVDLKGFKGDLSKLVLQVNSPMNDSNTPYRFRVYDRAIFESTPLQPYVPQQRPLMDGVDLTFSSDSTDLYYTVSSGLSDVTSGPLELAFDVPDYFSNTGVLFNLPQSSSRFSSLGSVDDLDEFGSSASGLTWDFVVGDWTVYIANVGDDEMSIDDVSITLMVGTIPYQSRPASATSTSVKLARARFDLYANPDEYDYATNQRGTERFDWFNPEVIPPTGDSEDFSMIITGQQILSLLDSKMVRQHEDLGFRYFMAFVQPWKNSFDIDANSMVLTDDGAPYFISAREIGAVEIVRNTNISSWHIETPITAAGHFRITIEGIGFGTLEETEAVIASISTWNGNDILPTPFALYIVNDDGTRDWMPCPLIVEWTNTRITCEVNQDLTIFSDEPSDFFVSLFPTVFYSQIMYFNEAIVTEVRTPTVHIPVSVFEVDNHVSVISSIDVDIVSDFIGVYFDFTVHGRNLIANLASTGLVYFEIGSYNATGGFELDYSSTIASCDADSISTVNTVFCHVAYDDIATEQSKRVIRITYDEEFLTAELPYEFSPFVESAELAAGSSQKITITGSFFGNEIGLVTVGPFGCSVFSWSTSEVICAVYPGYGVWPVEVITSTGRISEFDGELDFESFAVEFVQPAILQIEIKYLQIPGDDDVRPIADLVSFADGSGHPADDLCSGSMRAIVASSQVEYRYTDSLFCIFVNDETRTIALTEDQSEVHFNITVAADQQVGQIRLFPDVAAESLSDIPPPSSNNFIPVEYTTTHTTHGDISVLFPVTINRGDNLVTMRMVSSRGTQQTFAFRLIYPSRPVLSSSIRVQSRADSSVPSFRTTDIPLRRVTAELGREDSIDWRLTGPSAFNEDYGGPVYTPWSNGDSEPCTQLLATDRICGRSALPLRRYSTLARVNEEINGLVPLVDAGKLMYRVHKTSKSDNERIYWALNPQDFLIDVPLNDLQQFEAIADGEWQLVPGNFKQADLSNEVSVSRQVANTLQVLYVNNVGDRTLYTIQVPVFEWPDYYNTDFVL